MSSRSSRRDFLKQGSVLAGAAAAARLSHGPFLLAADLPNSKLNVAVIGCGGMGGYSTGMALRENFVAIADVDDNTVAKTMKETIKEQAKPKVFVDYRKMLDECHKDIDVVLIATPDHNHAPAAIRAIELGKHVFCQKPLAHNIRECRVLAEAAKRKKVHTQMGNQGHCAEGYRRLCEYIWAGAIGNVTEVQCSLGRDFGGFQGRPATKPVPAGLHWDEWLGPAPYREYHDGLHPANWRNWRAFGTGTLGDMACHVMDGIFWALKIGEAKNYSIECLSQKPGSDEVYSSNNVIRWVIPARAGMPEVTITGHDNLSTKPSFFAEQSEKNKRKFGDGTIYKGDNGLYMVTETYGDGVRILPEEAHKAFPVPEKKIPRVKGGPIEDLFNAVRGGAAPCSNFVDYSGAFAEFILSGHLAMVAGPGKKVEWDVAAMKCTNLPEINQFVGREYRKGWEV